MRGYALISMMTVSLLVACAGEQPNTLPPGGSGEATSAGRLYFDTSVRSMFEARCSKCHANDTDQYNAPDYLGLEGPDHYYDHLVTRTDFVSCNTGNSLLLNKGFDPGHPGGALSGDEHQRVQTWLEIEADDRFGSVCGSSSGTMASGAGGAGGASGTGGGGGAIATSGPTTGIDAMKQFGDCMTLEDWNSTGMPLVANQTSHLADITYNCYSCHNAPQGMNLMPDPNAGDATTEIEKAFTYMRYMYASFNLVVWTVNDTDGSFKDIVKSNRWRDKGVEAQQPNSTHPAYDLTDDHLKAYDDWFDLTYARWQSGDCSAPSGAGGAGGAGGGTP